MGQHVYEEIERALAAIVQPNSVFEIRLLGGQRKRIDAGYFNSTGEAANAVVALQRPYQGIYVTPNPVLPDLMARSHNRFTEYAQFTTMDPDITRRYWLLVDVDPVRPAGISSTDAQHAAAIRRARLIAGLLSFQYGWCDPMLNSSGNGAHLMYPFDEDNSNEVRDAVAKFLKCLSARFSDAECSVDTTVFNAARIWRVPGTWARKGDSVQDRPHRKAAILEPLRHLSRVRLEQVQQFIETHEYLLPLNQQTRQEHVGAQPLPVASDAKYTHVNNHAMRRIPEWVPVFFPDARPYKEGYRIGSSDLGRIFEEDLTIHPWPLGIKDFGPADQGDPREGRRTPVQVIAEFCTDEDLDLAARKLADVLQVPLTEFTALPSIADTPANSITLPGVAALTKYDFSAIRSFNDLRQEEFRPQTWIIPDVLPTGTILLAARPKMRKTWLALQLGMAIASGGKFLNWNCNKGDVLFLALEDNKRRMRTRIDTLLTFEMRPPDLSGFRYWTGGMSQNSSGKWFVSDPQEAQRTLETFPTGKEGIRALDQFLDEFPHTTTVIIDTLARFRERSNERDVYQRDYDAMMPITEVCSRRNILGLLVTHEKKGLAGGDSADFLEDVTGSAGITGGVDGVMSIKGRRGVQEENESRKLLLSGRDIPHDFELDMAFDAQRGGWLTAARQDVKVAIRDLLARIPFVTQPELKSLLPNVSASRLTRALVELKHELVINSTKYGYQLNRS